MRSHERPLSCAVSSLFAIVGVLLALFPAETRAQRAAAAFDMTGYWVSVITQDWRLRMVTPAKGDVLGIPLTPAALKVAQAWDPAKDEAAGDQCKAYGAAAIMTRPQRLHVTWQDENTLRMDIDAGSQTRLFHFSARRPTVASPTWQGYSTARWGVRSGASAPAAAKPEYLEVRTTRMRAGYLRQNGVPYGENATLTEYYDSLQEPDGNRLLIVTTMVEDPMYLSVPLVLTAQYKRQNDASGWDPTPCSARW